MVTAAETFGDAFALTLHQRAAELKQHVPYGSAPFLSELATWVMKEEGRAGTSEVYRTVKRAANDKPLTLGPRAEAKLRELAHRQEFYNPAEAFHQLANEIFADLREQESPESA